MAGATSPENLARLQTWLDAREQQGSASPGTASCANNPTSSDDKRYLDDSTRRWKELLRQVDLQGGKAEFSVTRQTADEEPRLLFAASELQGLSFGFVDLPEQLQPTLGKLRPGDSVRYRISTTANGLVIDQLTPYPDYVKQ